MAQKTQQNSAASSRKAWLQLLHFGPSLFTTILFAIYILIAAHGIPTLGVFIFLLASQLATQFSISLLNDVWDYDLDQQTKADKPLPSGLITLTQAAELGILCAALALLFSWAASLGALFFCAIGLAAGLLYDYRFKRTALSWLPFAIGFGVLPLWAWSGLGLFIPAQVWWALPLIAVLVLALHLADTLPDLEEDKAAGLRGLAQRLGKVSTLRLCWGALAAGIVAAAILGTVFAARYVLLWLVLLCAVALLGAAVFIYRQQQSRGLRRMAGLIELASMLVALGWVAATNL